MKPSTFRTLLSTSAVASALVCIAAALAPPQIPTGPAVERLQSSDRQVRIAARNEIARRHEHLVDQLIEIVRKERTDHQLDDEKELAINLLGESRAAKAVDVLLDNLMLRLPKVSDEVNPRRSFPCLAALTSIGKPSVKGLLARLDGDQYLSDKRVPPLFFMLVHDVEGPEMGKALMEAELKKAEPGSAREANILAILDWFNKVAR